MVCFDLKKGFISKRLRSSRKTTENPIESKTEIIQAKKFEWIDFQI